MFFFRTTVSDCFRLRFNDGAIDCMGRFWAGSMYEYISAPISLNAALISPTENRNLGVKISFAFLMIRCRISV
jgi:sugar lactone lactonase YvrE